MESLGCSLFLMCSVVCFSMPTLAWPDLIVVLPIIRQPAASPVQTYYAPPIHIPAAFDPPPVHIPPPPPPPAVVPPTIFHPLPPALPPLPHPSQIAQLPPLPPLPEPVAESPHQTQVIINIIPPPHGSASVEPVHGAGNGQVVVHTPSVGHVPSTSTAGGSQSLLPDKPPEEGVNVPPTLQRATALKAPKRKIW